MLQYDACVITLDGSGRYIFDAALCAGWPVTLRLRGVVSPGPSVVDRADLPNGVDHRMWPHHLEAWISQLSRESPGFLGQDECAVRNMLRQYPPLFDVRNPDNPAWDEANWIAHVAATRARDLARGFHGHVTEGTPDFPDYVRDVREFRLWLTNVGYRQALRLALRPERIETQLSLLPIEQRRLLNWRYLDRWTDEEVATALRFTMTPGRLTTPEEARRLSTQAYRAFCARLRAVIPVGNVNVSTFFPIFPGGVP